MASDSEGFESAEEDAATSKKHLKNKKAPQEDSNAWDNDWSDSEGETLAIGGGGGDDNVKSELLKTTSESIGSGDSTGDVTSKIEHSKRKTSRRPEREQKQPRVKGAKLGAMKLGSKLPSKSEALVESEKGQLSEPKQGNSGIVEEAVGRGTQKSVDEHEKDFQPVLEKLSSLRVSSGTSQGDSQSSGWGGWSSWGVNSILSTASSLTTHVSQGLSTVTSVLETGLGAPDPEELARLTTEQEKSSQEENGRRSSESAASSSGGSGGTMSFDKVLRLVESTAEGIVSGGLNTLETLGKKTMDVLQDGDPGLKKKRAYLFPDSERPVLSQLLREAKERAEAGESATSKAEGASAQERPEKKLHFETLFDDYQGLVHLEALEMLSRQCQLRLQSRLLALSGTQLTELQRTLAQVKELCEFPDEEEESSEECTPASLRENLQAVADGLGVPLPYEKVVCVYEEEDKWFAEIDKVETNVGEVHAHAITALAKLAAATAELFHKMAELLLVKDVRNTTEEAKQLVVLTTLLCSCTSTLATRFSDAFTAVDTATSDINDSHRSITNIFLEASNSSSYIQDAGNLLVPILQMGICK